ncbi:ferritin-like domain-containing protein [Comamonas endophytica]|uniref:Ferritin-like domain-containing protein n=1 Tax=Comamonas endophytica TaxID=2949090 RepID=A0ABY6GBD5_9BURK|nr:MULTISPECIES: ferritin-like domain-containing protein [unclassified Acidovorax]MCD2513629.1 ferritin-like domain-containing protein [Acidovorax sp. D4N7]UYG52363.1 ferritin-like domain-containing protein [Acidovorax sp. 5MLIR]
MELRRRALEALCLADPERKALQTLHMHSRQDFSIDPAAELAAPAGILLPGHPERPELRPHTEMARRSPATPLGRAVLIHAIAHIEFNAINLALDAIWRFPRMPEAFYRDWLQVAAEEAKHFQLLRAHLRSQGHDYGDFPAHQGQWTMCEKTQGDIVARMALVPRTMEARGLDATPQIQAKLRQVGTGDALAAVEILDVILREEVGHVAIGNHWYRWLCARDGLDPETHYAELTRRYAAPRMRPPFNTQARRAAGFSESELRWLEQS